MEPHGQEQVSTLMDIVSKPVPQHAEIQKLRKWNEPILEEATTMISNDVLKGFHTPMMAGGLFDDENEDIDLFGTQSGNIWLHTAVSSDAGTQIEQKEKEKGAVGDFLAFEPDKPKSELKALSSPKKPSTFLAGSYEHVHDSLFANESTSSLTLKDTLSFLRKGLFEDDEDEETENGDIFGPSNGAGIGSSSKEIRGTDLGDSMVGNIKGMSSHSNDSVITNTESINESFESTGIRRGASIDLQNEAASSKMPEWSANYDKLEGLSNHSREESTFSSLEPLSEARRKLEEVGSVPFTHKSNPERMLGYPDYRNGLPSMKTQHISNREKVLNVESGDDDMSTWSSASSTIDSLNIGQSCVEESLLNGMKPEESEQQTGNLEGLAEHPTHQVGEVADSSRSEFSTNIVKQEYGGENGIHSTTSVEPTMARTTSSREEANEELRNSSSIWSRKVTTLQEHLGLQPTMFSPQQKRIQKTEPSTFVADALQENAKILSVQTQRPSQGMNNLHHVTMSRPRGPKRRAPTSRQSGSPVLMTHINAGSSPEEELAGGPSSDFMVKEHDSIGKTEAFLRTEDATLSVPFENANIGGDTGMEPEKCASDDSFSTFSNGEELTKSSKKATEGGSADKFSAQKPQAGLLNTPLFKDEDDEDGLLGRLQGLVHSSSAGTAPLSKGKLSQGLPRNNEGSAKGEYLEGAAGKVPDQTFQERSTVEHHLSRGEYFRRSLFDDDDDEDDLFS